MNIKSSQVVALIVMFVLASSSVFIAVRQFLSYRNQVYWDAYYGYDK